MDVKAKIKAIMKEKGMTVYALAQKSDLSQACIANWYNERNYEPSLDALQKISNGFGMTLSELFCDDDEEIYPVNQTTKEFLQLLTKLDVRQKEALLNLMKSFVVID